MGVLLNTRAWLTAFKTSLAAVIAMGLAMAFGWDKPYWAGISSIVATLPYVGASLEKGTMRLIGTVLAGAAAYLIMALFPQDQVGFCALWFAFLAAAAYGAQGKTYPYMFFLFGITLSLICAESFNQIDRLWDIVFFRVSEISLGVVVTLTVNTLLWPQRADTDMNAQMAVALGDCATLFSYAVNRHEGRLAPPIDTETLRARLDAAFLQLHTLLPQAVLDSSVFSHHPASLRGMLHSLQEILIAGVSVLYAAAESAPNPYIDRLRTELEAYTDALNAQLAQLALFFKSQATLPPSTVHAARAALNARLAAVGGEISLSGNAPQALIRVKAYLANLEDFETALTHLREAAIGLTKPGRERRATHRRAPSAPRWRLDTRRLQYAIKVPVAILLMFYFWQWTRMPEGVSGLIMVAVLALKSMVSSNQFSLWRLASYLAMGAAGSLLLLFLTPHMQIYAQYGTVIFLLLMFFSMVSQADQRYSYAGLPALLGFVMVTWIYDTQVVSIYSKVNTFISVGVGVVFVVFVFRLLWPLIPERQLRESLARFFSEGADYLRLCDFTPATRAVRASAAGFDSGLSAAETWLGQIGLPAHDEIQRAHYRKLIGQLQALRLRLQALHQVLFRPGHAALARRAAPAARALNERLRDCLNAFSNAVEKGKPLDPGYCPDFAAPLAQLEAGLQNTLHADGGPQQEDEAAFLLAVLRRYREAAACAHDCRAQLARVDLSVMNRSAFF